jgi:hypothetical protein
MSHRWTMECVPELCSACVRIVHFTRTYRTWRAWGQTHRKARRGCIVSRFLYESLVAHYAYHGASLFYYPCGFWRDVFTPPGKGTGKDLLVLRTRPEPGDYPPRVTWAKQDKWPKPPPIYSSISAAVCQTDWLEVQWLYSFFLWMPTSILSEAFNQCSNMPNWLVRFSAWMHFVCGCKHASSVKQYARLCDKVHVFPMICHL